MDEKPDEGTLQLLPTPGWPKGSGFGSGYLEQVSRTFNFPYPVAYSIQIDLMQAVFRTIEESKIGLFESPTGTGKSLSIICAAFTWLQKNAERKMNSLGSVESGEDPDWIIAYETKKKEEDLTMHEEELQRRIEVARKKAAAVTKSTHRGDSKRRRTNARVQIKEDDDSDNEYLIGGAEYGSARSGNTAENDEAYLSPAVRALMEHLDPEANNSSKIKPFYARPSEGDEEDEPETQPKIIYASRTHTQLSQFISELKKTSFGKDLKESVSQNPVRNISLGSRKQMCINSSVQDLGKRVGMEAMNERCIELMKGSKVKKSSPQSKEGSHCQFLPPSTEEGQTLLLEYRDNAFTQVRDIEDLVELGREMDICPYFGARSSARQAQLITLPYNLLLQANARSSLNITLKDSVVIVDEAHNLIDTILSIHTVSITSKQIQQARAQIKEYLRRFSTKLRGSNEVNLQKLFNFLDSLDNECTSQQMKFRSAKTVEEIVTSVELVRRLGGNLDQINLLELEAWLKETQIARKVAGYAEKQKFQSQKAALSKDLKVQNQSALSAMHTIEAFLLSLANQSEDGRVLLSLSNEGPTDEPSISLKYQLLNPADVFGEIAKEARSVILAGGTMEPISDFTTQLFAKMDASKMRHFSCNHVIPPENLMAAVIAKGPKGVDLEFKFDARGDIALLDDLTNCIANYCNVIPNGIVVFLPSYAFLDVLVSRWKVGQGFQRISAKKSIFYEPKLATQVDTVLRDYTLAATSTTSSSSSTSSTSSSGITGAILFAVVGAKLSEGINFSDRLARAVIMVGMPFANSASAELRERMKYVRSLDDENDRKVSSTGVKTAKVDAGQELYINLCMKAVNQSIGRAIRHQSDYAALILLDRRYGRKDIRGRLPAWIRPSVKMYDSFGPSMSALGAFFREKRAKGIA